MSSFAARNRVAIVGYAQSPIERVASVPLGVRTVQTVRRAIDDAGLAVSHVDGFVTAPLFPTLGSHANVDGFTGVTASWLAQHLPVTPRYVASLQGQMPGSVALAVHAIVSGAADNVVVHRALHNPGGRYHATADLAARGADQWASPQGHFGPIVAMALAYNEYAQRYGVPDDALADVVIEARKNGARVPWSHWRDAPLTRAEYLAAPFIDDPMRRLDCDIPVDGVTAFVLTSAERARDLPNRPVYIAGYADCSPVTRRIPSHWPLDDIVARGTACMQLLSERAGLALADIDLPQVYDGFSPLVFFWLELLGLCGPGEAPAFVAAGGIDSDRVGARAVLSGGGALGNGRMHGAPQMLECYLQLAGRAGDRQRPDLTAAVACQGIPHMGGAVVYTNAR